MENLSAFHMRAHRELLDFYAFFGINESTRPYIFPIEKPLKAHKLRRAFEEHCRDSAIRPEQVEEYEELLLKRKRDVEAVIDDHFKQIREVIEDEKLEKRERDIEKTFGKEDYRQKIEILIIKANFDADPDRAYDDPNIYTYEKKLQQLCDHQDALIRHAKEGDRRKVQNICRMKGQTQSYFIFDSQRFKVAKKIYYNLENEEEEFRKEHELEDIIDSGDSDGDAESDADESSNQHHSGVNLLQP